MTFKKLNCSEFMRRGDEPGGRNVDHLSICPAFPYQGQECANEVGTFCDLVQVLRTASHADCQECPFYNNMYFNQSGRRVNQVKAL
jgi:hypothetical protein